MTNHRNRFSYDAPRLFRFFFYVIRYPSDWREKIRAWITDHERGEQFQLSEDEEVMMTALSKNMEVAAGSPEGGDSFKSIFFDWLAGSEQVWTPDKIDEAKDHVLAAISDRRRGDETEWQRLVAMTANGIVRQT